MLQDFAYLEVRGGLNLSTGIAWFSFCLWLGCEVDICLRRRGRGLNRGLFGLGTWLLLNPATCQGIRLGSLRLSRFSGSWLSCCRSCLWGSGGEASGLAAAKEGSQGLRKLERCMKVWLKRHHEFFSKWLGTNETRHYTLQTLWNLVERLITKKSEIGCLILVPLW